MKQVFKATLVALFMIGSAWAGSPASAGTPASAAINALDVFIKDHEEAVMNWNNIPGAGPYYVGVYDLTDGARFANFTTLNRKDVIVNGLTQGHNYRFTVSKGTTLLTVDVVA